MQGRRDATTSSADSNQLLYTCLREVGTCLSRIGEAMTKCADLAQTRTITTPDEPPQANPTAAVRAPTTLSVAEPVSQSPSLPGEGVAATTPGGAVGGRDAAPRLTYDNPVALSASEAVRAALDADHGGASVGKRQSRPSSGEVSKRMRLNWSADEEELVMRLYREARQDNVLDSLPARLFQELGGRRSLLQCKGHLRNLERVGKVNLRAGGDDPDSGGGNSDEEVDHDQEH